MQNHTVKSNGSQPSPCLSCSRVPCPEDCENKTCKPWRQWFLSQWERLRSTRGLPERREEDSVPTPAADPCISCRCPQHLCLSPCRAKESWEAAR